MPDTYLNGFGNHACGTRCVLLIRTAEPKLPRIDPAYIQPICIGRLTDVSDRCYMKVQHIVEYHEAEIKCEEKSSLLGTRSPSRFSQVWPTIMSFQISLQGAQHSHGQTDVKHMQDWWVGIPAKNGAKCNGSDEEIEVIDDPVLIDPNKLGLSKKAFEVTMLKAEDSKEKEYLNDLLKAKRLYHLQILTYPRHLASMNTFMLSSESKEYQSIVDYVERLYSPDVANTKISIEMIFEDTATCNSSPSTSNMLRSLRRFRNSRILENRQPDLIYGIYGVTPQKALDSTQGSKKHPDDLPAYRIPVPLVYYSREQWIMSQSLDLHLMHSFQQLQLLEFSKLTFTCLPMLFDKSRTRTKGLLIHKHPDMNPSIKLQSRQFGRITWLNNSETKEWIVRLVPPSEQFEGNDVFALAFPESSASGGISFSMFDRLIVESECIARTFRQSIKDIPHNKIHLKLISPGKTEKQQFDALCSINPFSSLYQGTAQQKARVPPILMGQGLKKLTKESVFSKGFAEAMLKDPSKLNQKFAKGIGVPGARLSEEQLNMVLKYPSQAPSDGLLIAQGYAGTRKTSSIGAFAVAQYLDVNKGGTRKTGVIVSEMHATANHTVQSLENIIFVGTDGKRIVRDYGLEQDVRSIMFALDGCSAKRNANWSQGMGDGEFTDMKEMMDSISGLVNNQSDPTNSTKFSAVNFSAIWIMLQEFGLLDCLKVDNKRFATCAKEVALNTSNDPVRKDLVKSIRLCQDILEYGEEDPEEPENNRMVNTMEKLRTIKQRWMQKNVAVVVTTISRIGELTITPAWTVCDESQCVSVHNITIWLAAFHDITRYMVGDIAQLGPYCDDEKYNSFSDVRSDSLLAKEIKRGRPYAVMTVSGRTGPSAIELPSRFCYNSRLSSGIDNHPYTQNIIAFHRRVFGSRSNECPHLFINAGIGTEVQVGIRKSATNPDLMMATKAYMKAYRNAHEVFKSSDIAIVAPWATQKDTWQKYCRQMGEDASTPGTVQSIMGDDAIVVILEIAKTKSLGFLDMHGMWTVALTRSRASTVIIANHTALMETEASRRGSTEDFEFYNNMVCWFKKKGCFVEWPENLRLSY